MRRSTFGPTIQFLKPGPHSADISTSTIACVRIRALIAAHRTKLTSARHPWRWRHEFSAAVFSASLVGLRPSSVAENTAFCNEPGRNPLIVRGKLFRRTGPALGED